MKSSRPSSVLWGLAIALGTACSAGPDTASGNMGGSDGGGGGLGAGGPFDGSPDGWPTEAGGGGDPDAGSPTGPLTPESVCRAAFIAQCERRRACGRGQPYCEQLADLCPDYYFNAQSNRTVEGTAACIAEIRALPCSDVGLSALPTCLVDGRAVAYATCAFASQCASGTCQVGGGSSCGTCSAPIALGEPCTGPGQCEGGAFCHDQTQKCTANSTIVHGGPGATCNRNVDPVLGCERDLWCLWDGSPSAGGICKPPPGDGEPCAASLFGNDSCAPGLDCIGDTCSPAGKCGAATCDASSYCSQESGSAKCVPFATEAQSCAPGSYGDPRCDPTTYCSTTADGGGVCIPARPRSIGEPCDPSHFCDRLMKCENGQCVGLTSAECSHP
jgi:hypothetical protein